MLKVITTKILDLIEQTFVVNNHEPSLSKYREGAYRGLNGSKCSIGVLIDDNIYHPKFEGLDVVSLMDRFPYIGISLQSKGLYPSNENDLEEYTRFLVTLQWWHDVWLLSNYKNKEAVRESIAALKKIWT